MFTDIKNLELIGRNTSLKQHGSVSDMLLAMGFKSNVFENLHSKEYICALAPDDDSDDSDESE